AGTEAVRVNVRKPAHYSGELPQSVLNYVARTREPIIIDDALEANAHSGDPYIIRVRPRSVLCMPLLKQTKLVGVLYLENDLAAHTFTQARLAVLQLIAAQAAISIENAELFLDVQRTKEEISRAGDELRLSFDMIPALAWSASPDGSLEFSNKQWHDYTGISAENACGDTWMRSFHPDDLEKVREKWRHVLRFRTSGEFEARMQRFDGDYRSFLVRVTPMRDHRGEVIKWHGTNTDIDDLKRAERAQETLARASRVTALGELTVSIAHEVNQPLMAIVTNAATCLRWLSGERPDLSEARLAAERIIRDGHRAGDVIASIRAMAKKSAREPSLLRLDQIVLEVLQLTRNELDRYAVVVETQFAEYAIEAIADRVQMQQVILNLVMNAIEAMAAPGGENRVLRITSHVSESNFVAISVADTGPGISPAVVERVFDAFFTTKPDGIGIGLSICRTIVETHGGGLTVAANHPHGSVFTFTVPRFAERIQIDSA
ncbi:MAG TPA: ATP-binding protein, partial [Thermoanaerobaculia bacterium]